MTIAVDPAGFGNDHAVDAVEVRRLPGLVTAAVASIGAGAIHAAATGIHAEHPTLARLFVVVAVLQLGAGLLALVRPSRPIAAVVALVNLGAVAGWIATRLSGISWIDGLGQKEAPQFADTVCAVLGSTAIGAAIAAALAGWHMAAAPRFMVPGLVVAALTVPAMVSGGTHLHEHDDSVVTADHGRGSEADGAPGGGTGAAPGAPAADEGHAHSDGDGHADGDLHDDPTAGTAAAGSDTTEHGHGTGDSAGTDDVTATTAAGTADRTAHGHGDIPVADGRSWPWPYDPAEPVELAGVPGVTAEQEARAEGLVRASLEQLPQFSDVTAIEALGYSSIGDAATGYEHFINRPLIDGDERFLDPSAPESLVFRVDKATGTRTLVSAMFIAKTGTAMDAVELTDFAGPLITWHAHNNLCWTANAEGRNVIVGVTDANGNCARGVRGGGDNPMVHVWIVPHQCGPFAALEGVGAGGAAVPEAERTDMCREEHADGHGPGSADGDPHSAPPAAGRKYDPSKPIDLSGFEGVTEEQQAAAENLVAVNVVRLPQWADYKVAEAAGMYSIGDGGTGHEHFIQWDWIDDDVWLDPDQPEALVYAPQPDGTKKLVSAMYMLPTSIALEDVPDIGGRLMQWHIHDNLCFTKDPLAPTVGGLTDTNGNCPPALQKFPPSAMIHVWITPHPCGPFAALEGVGAGQIAAGQERLCDEVHGSH